MLVGSIVMIWMALSMRVRIGPRQFQSPPASVALVFTGIAWYGISMVLLIRSPFRMTPPERLSRLVWLGPIGRGFVRLSMRGVKTSDGPVRRARPAPQAHLPVVVPATSPAQVPASIVPIAPTLASLDARVAELERWRRDRGNG